MFYYGLFTSTLKKIAMTDLPGTLEKDMKPAYRRQVS
jgi:hypothetical protein